MNIHKLKQARKNADITLQDMAYLLDIDVSNLSKYERGIKQTSLKVSLGYAIITSTALDILLAKDNAQLIQQISERTTGLIVRLEQGEQNPKRKHRTSRLYDVLNHLSRLYEERQKRNGK